MTGEIRPARVRMVHLGAGAFFRAHTAVLTEDADSGVPARDRWGIAAVAHSSRAVVRALRARDGRYGVVELGGGAVRARDVGAVREALVGADEPAAVRARLADPEVTVVTVTVTEAGYHHDPVTRRLRTHDPDLQADLADEHPTRTLVGRLVAGLGDRAAAGAPELSVLVCDNVDDGGPLLAGLVAEFCTRSGRGALADWIAGHVRFPTTVVDRIVPAPGPEAHAVLREHLGRDEEAGVVTETHRQWVITDDLAAPRPAWERAGALVVPDAAPWARAKLRLVNAPHTALALLGGLRGHTLVREAMADDALAATVAALLHDELVPTVPAVPRLDPAAAARTSLERFADPALAHPLAQIATDTSLKIGPRLLAPALELRRAGRAPVGIAAVLAAWVYRLGHADGADLRDVHAPRLRRAAAGTDPVAAVLGCDDLVPPELGRDRDFLALVTDAHDRLVAGTAREATSWT
ncbi:MAG TPA: mannitol dehydrogenase family protein [Actinomycetospora sp.]|nr:mannitol dehydrogenase family protein [Actinomycetospora sp.]